MGEAFRRRSTHMQLQLRQLVCIIMIQSRWRAIVARRRVVPSIQNIKHVKGLAAVRMLLADQLEELQHSIHTLRYPPSCWNDAALTVQRWWRGVLLGRVQTTMLILKRLRQTQASVMRAA